MHNVMGGVQMLQTDNVCIVIPTHNRHVFLERCISYYSNFNCKVIIVDSSIDRFKFNCVENVIYLHLPGKSFAEKMVCALSSISNEFIVLSPDDDFIIASTIEVGLSKLKANSNVQAFLGKTLSFRRDEPLRFFKPLISRSPPFPGDSSRRNIHRILFNYHNVLWSLFRKESLLVALQSIAAAHYEDDNFIELTIATICAARGGVLFTDAYWVVREIPESFDHWGSRNAVKVKLKKNTQSDESKFKMQMSELLFIGAGDIALREYFAGQASKPVWRRFIQRGIWFFSKYCFPKSLYLGQVYLNHYPELNSVVNAMVSDMDAKVRGADR